MKTAPRRGAARRTSFRRLAIEPIEPRHLLAFAAELAVDVDARPVTPATEPAWLTECNGLTFYSSDRDDRGRELWVSDGTRAGTRLVKDVASGIVSSNPQWLTNVNGTLFFAATTSANGRELWRSDGTAAGTMLVRSIQAGDASSDPTDLTNVNGKLFFTASDAVHGRELWTSDGSGGGTKLVKELRAGTTGAQISNPVASNGLLFFVTTEADGVRPLWRSNGTAAGTFKVADGGAQSGSLTSAGTSLFFVRDTASNGSELWRSKGTAASTQLVADIRPGSSDSGPTGLVNVGGTIFFTADDGQHGRDLWKSNGVLAGTSLVRDLDNVLGTGSTLANVNGKLFFVGNDRSKLWKSDGSSAGTVLVADGDATISAPLTNVGDKLYFSASNNVGRELWKSDGTGVGTVLVKDIYPDPQPDNPYSNPASYYSGNPALLTGVSGKLMFVANDAIQGSHLFTSDGTAAGTRVVDDRQFPTASSGARPVGNFNGKLLISTRADSAETSLLLTDGTAAGTKRLLSPEDSLDLTGTPYHLGVFGGLSYFAGQSGNHLGGSLQLWRTDGTVAGTITLTAFSVGDYYRGSGPHSLTDLNGQLLFVGSSRSGSPSLSDLWTTDGTESGTTMVKNVEVATPLARMGDFVYFGAANDHDYYELWRSDGTEAGTQLLKNIRTQAEAGSRPEELTVLDKRLLFTADDGVHGCELWRSDGTAAGTILLRDLEPGIADSNVSNLTVVGDALFFTTLKSDGAMSLWKTDGTKAGTVRIAGIGLAQDEYPGPKHNPLTNVNGKLFFVSERDGHGYELWMSDGTAAGTRLVEDLIPGAVGAKPTNLQEINGVLFFVADLPTGGRGYWISNGMPGGTYPLTTADTPLTAQSGLTNVNGALYFSGTDAQHGQELWRFTTARSQISFSGGTLNYRENEPLKLIAPFATISDADNVRFNGGRLTVAVTKNPSPEDRLEIRHQGDAPGQIGVAPRWIRYGGVTIGSYRTGASAAELLIDLNFNATVAATQALLRNIGFRTTSENPSTKTRTVVVRLTDGSGGLSQPVSKTISVTSVNDPPRLVLGGQLAYKNNSSAILLAAAATVSDPDSANFFGGVLTVDLTSGRSLTNRLLVGGAYSMQSGQLVRNGVVVGEVLEDGVGWHALRLRFNSQMTPSRVQELVRSLRFRTVDNTNLDPRIISFTLTDGDGGVSATQTKTVNVTN